MGDAKASDPQAKWEDAGWYKRSKTCEEKSSALGSQNWSESKDTWTAKPEAQWQSSHKGRVVYKGDKVKDEPGHSSASGSSRPCESPAGSQPQSRQQDVSAGSAQPPWRSSPKNESIDEDDKFWGQTNNAENSWGNNWGDKV